LSVSRKGRDGFGADNFAEQDGNNPMELFNKYKWQISLAYLALMVGILYWINSAFGARRPEQIYFSDFISEVRSGNMRDVRITDSDLVGVLKQDGIPGHPAIERKVRAQRLPGMDMNTVLKEFETRHVRYTGHQEWSETPLIWIVPLIIMVGVYVLCVWRVRQGAGSLLGFSRNRGNLYADSDANRVTFSDVAGVDESKAELVEVVDFLKSPDKYQKLGGHVPRGVLLVGPPGTGKTLLAKAVAGEAGVPFLSISGSEFVEMFVGVGAARVRSLFRRARQKAPCIVFIDELDAIGKSRSSDRRPTASHDERDQTLNQLLVEMDGFDSSASVIVMAATNTPEVLDQALIRPGRFDRQIVVDKADLPGREAILRIHARKISMSPDVDLGTIAARTPGMVGADLANIINEAAILGARRNAQSVAMSDLEAAIDRVLLGLEKNRVMSPAIKERVAYHESGHALVAVLSKHADPVHRVSIIPRSIGALGHVLQLPTEEKYLMTQPEIEDQIAVMLGGRAAEEIIYDGVVSTGASNDLERASELVRQIITRYGMTERLGQLTYGRTSGSRHLRSAGESEERNYSERTAELIDEESRRLIDSIYERVVSLLLARRADLERLAQELIRRETLDRSAIDRLLEKKALRAS
jgi:cell division protease FtsH